MSETIEPSDYFKKIKNTIVKNRDKSKMDKSKEVVVFSFAGLDYSITASNDETITFKALEMDFMMKPSGEIQLMENEDGKVSFHYIDEGPLTSKLREYISWRADVVQTLGI